uniref:Uncharacterized protein n=1 Tax=Amphimedon queenslandica TaxID=400682 RepID=A0A1X7TIK7_AMPQE
IKKYGRSRCLSWVSASLAYRTLTQQLFSSILSLSLSSLRFMPSSVSFNL